MGVVVTVAVVALVGMWFFVKIVRTVSITAEKTKDHNRCVFCRSRLKRTADRMHYAPVCPKCARTQPWAPPDST